MCVSVCVPVCVMAQQRGIRHKQRHECEQARRQGSRRKEPNMKSTFVTNVATISEDLLRKAASDGGKPRTGMPQSGLGLARPPNAVPS